MARSKTRSKQQSESKPRGATFSPPKGFKVLNAPNGFGTSHDFYVEPIVQGEVVEIKDIPKAPPKIKRDTRVMVLKTKAGLRTVWDAAQLHGLFDMGKKIIGKAVFIQFTGTKKIKGQRNPMKEFSVAVR